MTIEQIVSSTEKWVPKAFCCPITKKIMEDPALLLENGKSYEQKALEDWLRINGDKDPETGKSFFYTTLIPNYTLKTAIADLKASTDSVEKILESFLCSIVPGIMNDPVMLIQTGHSYEYENIKKWLDGYGNTCPKTNEILDNHTLIENKTFVRNITLKLAIEELKAHQEKSKLKNNMDELREIILSLYAFKNSRFVSYDPGLQEILGELCGTMISILSEIKNEDCYALEEYSNGQNIKNEIVDAMNKDFLAHHSLSAMLNGYTEKFEKILSQIDGPWKGLNYSSLNAVKESFMGEKSRLQREFESVLHISSAVTEEAPTSTASSSSTASISSVAFGANTFTRYGQSAKKEEVEKRKIENVRKISKELDSIICFVACLIDDIEQSSRLDDDYSEGTVFKVVYSKMIDLLKTIDSQYVYDDGRKDEVRDQVNYALKLDSPVDLLKRNYASFRGQAEGFYKSNNMSDSALLQDFAALEYQMMYMDPEAGVVGFSRYGYNG